MKITLKTMQNQQYSLDVEKTDTVLEVKKKIEAQEKHEVASQKLIFTGKVLEDDKILDEYNIKENDFLVLLVRKITSKPSQTATQTSTPPTTTNPSSAPTTTTTTTTSSTSTPTSTTTTTPTSQATPTQTLPTTATQAPSTTPTTTTTPEVTNTTTPTSAPSTTTPSSTTPSSETQRSALTAAAETLVVPGSAEYEAIISRLLELGYERQRIVAAMRASFNNPDRAVEYLMSEIPQTQDLPPQPARVPSSPPVTAPSPPTSNAPASAPAISGVFDALRNNPQFMTIRGMIQNNPQLLQPILQSLGTANPELLQQISQNQEEFIRLLNEPVPRPPGGASVIPPGAGAEGSGAPGPH
jgi:UV excision repair protein RAD23